MIFVGLPIGLAIGILGISTVKNIQQTINLQKVYQRNNVKDFCVEPSILSSYLAPSLNGLPQAHVPIDKTTHEVVQDLEKMKREELILLFLSCDVSSEKHIRGDWDGLLLENNGPIMTRVSSFITDALFGQGRTWNGKAFLDTKPEESSACGINRFIKQGENQSSKIEITRKHNFDYSLEASLFGKRSIKLKYSKYQSLLSPWKSMRDEVRVLRPSSGPASENEGVLIGLGWMAWSGGRLNCSPFCLFQSDEKLLKKN